MSYDKINYRKLKSAFNSIDNISGKKITNLKNDISKSDWDSPICNRVKTAMDTLEKEYSNLKSKIDNYKKSLSYIKDYQDAKEKYENYSDKETENYNKYLDWKRTYDNTPDDNALKPGYKLQVNYYYDKYCGYKDKKEEAKRTMQQSESNIKTYIK